MSEIERLEKIIVKGGPTMAVDIVKLLGIPDFETVQVEEIVKEVQEDGADARETAHELMEYYQIDDDITDEEEDDFDEDLDDGDLTDDLDDEEEDDDLGSK